MRGDRAFLMILPASLMIGVIAIFPIVHAFRISLDRRMPVFGISYFVGVDNYRFLLQDSRFWQSFLNTAYFSLLSVSLELITGLILAILLHRSFRGRGLFRALVLIPWAVPTVVSARMWEWILNSEFGVLNYLLQQIGLLSAPLNWLGDRTLAMFALILADVWKTSPFAAIILLAGLQMIPEELYEAARVDGAGEWQIFRRITAPLLLPFMVIALLFRTLDAFRIFDLAYVLTGGGPASTTESLSLYAYTLLFQTLQFGYGSTVAVATFLAVLLLSAVYIVVFRRQRHG
ncbi:MAG: ABC transporter permease [Candidatus Methylomirabilota bacterium]|nr:sugar ABC transporter permease [Candidatus Methylomirabilis sp.]NJD67726.1 sugar ABC transporter permease [candidate division NC10 bacterium]PWB47762.1 MAG: ABC transporter permease [candidate division NC10 bacterium]